jgi:tetratricopeptide (TPR) repeat protein
MNDEKKYYTLLKEGQNLIRAGKYDKGHTIIGKAIKLCPDKCEAYGLLGDLYGSEGKYDLAIESHKINLNINPDTSIGHYSLGQCFWLTGFKNDAIDNLKIAINLDPKNHEAYRLIIEILISEGQHIDAYDWLIDAKKHYPDDGIINYMHALILIFNSEKVGVKLSNTVLGYLDKAENRGVNPVGVNKLRGMFYYQLSNWFLAAKFYSKSLVREYQEDSALCYIECLFHLKYYDECRDLISEMCERGSETAKELIQKYPALFEKS